LRSLVERVDRRTDQASGTYDDDRTYVRQAVEQVLVLRRRLDLGRFLGPVGPERTKPQFLLLFERAGGQRVVLKVYGKSRPGEAAVQLAWRRHGVRVVDVLDAGDDPTSWLVMRAVETVPVVTEIPPTGPRLRALTAEVAEIMAPAHVVGTQLLLHDEISVPTLQPLGEAIDRHLAVAVAALERHRYDLHRDWVRTAHPLYTSRVVTLLHGDLFVGNILRDAADHELLMVDSCGYAGPPEFDAARWAARAGGPTEAVAVLSDWLQIEPRLDARLAHGLLALELVMEAGVRELVKEEQGLPWHAHDATTRALLDSAEEILPTWTPGHCR
jgi:streptomycin 6-kinase